LGETIDKNKKVVYTLSKRYTMRSIYDYPEIYDERFSERANNGYKRHYEIMFNGKKITTILDCSFGTGNLTFCLAEAGYTVSGSDINKLMLDKAAEKAKENKLNIDFMLCDFRELSKYFERKFSCVMSTGNALAHVNNDDVAKTISEMDKLVEPNGYLYIDIRNYDKMLNEKERFQYAQPFFKEDGTRINCFQVWDYNIDGTITINIFQNYEKENKEIRRELFDETVYPVSLGYIIESIERLGYESIETKNLPCFNEQSLEETYWHCVLAHKR
jgi:ubiquinone/menaquinone biosynthesis C-methylase UbiE